jgi:glycosyltransferase involved in cell wall biosynthesis
MTRPVRVLHIIKTLGLGGAETNLLNLANAFDGARIETHVGYSYGGEIENRFRDAGVRLFKYADGAHRVKSLQSIAIIARLVRYIRRHRIDIVHTHNFNGHAWGLAAARLAGVRTIEHVHDYRYTPVGELARRHGAADQYRFITWFRNRSDRVIVLTRDHARFVIDQGFARAATVIEQQNGIALDAQTPRERSDFRERLSIPPDAVLVLTAARMDETKNIALVVRCAAALLRTRPDVYFVIAGAGPGLADYRAVAQRLGVDHRVLFPGFVADVENALAGTDIFLLPSFLELHSIAILEATKMAVPVVVSRGVGCNDEFITDGDDGVLCDPFDDRPWIEALERLVDDRALRQSIGRRGRETCERRFDIRGTAARFEAIYADLAV